MNVLVPRSRVGWWAAWFATGAAGFLLAGQLTAGISMIGAGSPRATTLLAWIALACVACVLAGFVTGIAALRREDRSAPVWVALVFGIAALLFVVGELAFPH